MTLKDALTGIFVIHCCVYWINSVLFCQTDDKGVFSTNLSEDYRIAAETYNLQNDDLWRISNESINYIFADDATKTSLRDEWQICRQDLLAAEEEKN